MYLNMKGKKCVKKIITIAIPVYNVEKYLRRCIDSIILKILKIVRFY